MYPFPEANLKSIRVISASLPAPIAIACYSTSDEGLIAGLESIITELSATDPADVDCMVQRQRAALLCHTRIQVCLRHLQSCSRLYNLHCGYCSAPS